MEKVVFLSAKLQVLESPTSMHEGHHEYMRSRRPRQADLDIVLITF